MDPLATVRAQVADSWVRSAAAGVEADRVEAPITLPDDALRDHREAHPLAQVFPLLDDVLGQAARDCDAIMAVSDAAGQLLWVCGTPSVLRRAESHRLRRGQQLGRAARRHQRPRHGPGASTSRSTSSAPSTSAARCSAGAARPRRSTTRPTESLLGVLDITGGDDIVVPQTMAMVRAAARMAESELARELLARGAEPAAAATRGPRRVTVEALGRTDALLTVDDGRGRRHDAAPQPAAQRDPAAARLGAPRAVRRRARRAALRGGRHRLDAAGRAQPAAQPARRGRCSPRAPTGSPPRSPATGSPSRRTSRPATSARRLRAYRGPAAAALDRAGRGPPAREHRGVAAPGRARAAASPT